MDKTYFYPNSCHICKRWDVELTSCAKCHMISYCNDDHQQDHLPKHKQICAAIRHVFKGKKYMNIEEISTTEWVEIRMYYLTKVGKFLKRDMTREESQMFLFPKACVVCHRQDGLTGCSDCPNAAFCNKHSNASEHRGKYCKLMRQSFQLEQYVVATEELNMGYTYVVGLFNKTPFYDMKSFLDTYVPLDKNNIILQMLHSNVITYPLTVYFCVEKLDYLRCETLNIHIVNADVYNRGEIHIWVILLMLIRTLSTLTITFIKSKPAFNKCYNTTRFANILWGKKLVSKEYYMSYEEYVGSRYFEEPNFIVGFHANVLSDSYAQDEYVNKSDRSGRVLAEQNCPCILIFDYLCQTDKDMLNKIKKDAFLNNPFTSSLPQRYFNSDDIIYSNNYLVIFHKLGCNKVFINSQNQCFVFLKTFQE